MHISSFLIACLLLSTLACLSTAGQPDACDASSPGACRQQQQRRHPVILVPGIFGSRIQGRWDKEHVPSFLCPAKSDGWTDLWFNPLMLVTGFADCFVDNLRLEWNDTTSRSQSPVGVKTRISGFGRPESVETLSASCGDGLCLLLRMSALA